MRKLLGVTLIELMFALAVLAVLVTVAIPSFSDLFMRNRMTTVANKLLSDLMLARSEAIKRGQRITICKKNSNACATTGNSNWDSGWIVFVDSDQDGVIDAGEVKLKVSEDLPKNFTLRSGANYTLWVSYRPDGTPIDTAGSGNNDTFRLCGSTQDTNESRNININRIGRAIVGLGTTQCP